MRIRYSTATTTTTATAETAATDAHLEAFQPIQVQKASDEVCIAILDALRSGLFTIGDRLPREKDLAERFQVSVHTVSQALQTLEKAAIIKQKRGQYGGTHVTSLGNVRVLLASLLSTVYSGSQAELRSLLELRRPLELQAALLAASRANEDQMQHLRQLCDALDANMSADAFRATDVQFHLYLGEICGNSRLRDYLRSYFDEYQTLRDRVPLQHLERVEVVQSQHAYCDAVMSRNPTQVIEAVDEHLGTTEMLFLGERLAFPDISRV